MLAVNDAPGAVSGAARGRWIWTVSGVLTAAALTALAARLAVSAGSPAAPVVPAAVRTYAVAQPVTSVDITSAGDPVRVTAADVNRVEVTIAFHGKAGNPPGPGTVTGGRLVLSDSGCGDGGWCADAFTLAVPRGTSVDVSTGGGPATVTGLAGSLRADTDGGPLSALSLGSADVSVATGGGPALIGFRTAPRMVAVTSTGGPARILVPGGPYALNADSGGGPENARIATDPSAGRTLLISTGGGPLRVGPSGE